MVFGRKTNKFGYLNPILRKLRVTHDLGWWFIWKPMVWLSICINWTFCCLLRFRVMKRNVYSSAIFTGGRLCTEILPGHGRPPSIVLGNTKLEPLGYPAVKTASLHVPSFWHNTGLWWTEGYASPPIAYTMLAKLALWHAVKTDRAYSTGPAWGLVWLSRMKYGHKMKYIQTVHRSM